LNSCRASLQIHSVPVPRHKLTAPTRDVFSTRASNSTNGNVKLGDALREAADGLVHTSEKYQAALESASAKDRALDREWKALSHHTHPVGVGDVPTEVPSVGEFCAKALRDFRCEIPPSLT